MHIRLYLSTLFIAVSHLCTAVKRLYLCFSCHTTISWYMSEGKCIYRQRIYIYFCVCVCLCVCVCVYKLGKYVRLLQSVSAGFPWFDSEWQCRFVFVGNPDKTIYKHGHICWFWTYDYFKKQVIIAVLGIHTKRYMFNKYFATIEGVNPSFSNKIYIQWM